MVIVCSRSLFNKYGWMAFVCYFENSKGTSMNREDIIRMAREAGFNVEKGYLLRITGIDEDLERFAALVASAERSACAKLCDDMEEKAEGVECCKWPTPIDCAYAIRARGQA